MTVRTRPMVFQTPQTRPQYLHVEWKEMSWAHRTEGAKGRIVNTRIATYFPRLEVGASSDVPAKAVSSFRPAPTPAKVMPPTKTISNLVSLQYCDKDTIPMKMFIVWAVEQMIMPRITNTVPAIATYRLPHKSDRDPVKGHTAARARRLASTNQGHRSRPPMSL